MKCRDLLPFVGDYATGTVKPAIGRWVRLHEASCPKCHEFLKSLKKTLLLLKNRPAASPTPRLRAALRKKLRS